MRTLTLFLASLIVATIITLYYYGVTFITNIVPNQLTPLVIILALTFAIHIITDVGHKR